MKISDDLIWRGLIKDKSFEDVSWLDKPQTFYWGVDASAPSMTVGNLAAVFLAKRLSDAGWKPILLMGGGTSMVGDPGGKTEERQLKSREEIEKNIAGVREQVTNLFKGQHYEMVDNYEWLSQLKYLDFLRDVGKHFPMTELLQREFVDTRMGAEGSGISYAEFSYSLLQGYDYWNLFKKYGAVLQVGGSDQWGNMLSGVALIRKKEAKEVQAMSMPLIIDKKTGVKFGKSEGGAIWLDPKLTTPTEFHQFWMNSSDDDVEDYLKIFTFMDRAEIEQVMADHQKDPSKRIAQKALAETVTALVHGSAAAEEAEVYAEMITSASVSPSAPPNEGTYLRLKPGTKLVDALVETNLASSKSEARRLIDSGGVYINNNPTKKEEIEESDFSEGWMKLRRGKAHKDSALIELSD